MHIPAGERGGGQHGPRGVEWYGRAVLQLWADLPDDVAAMVPGAEKPPEGLEGWTLLLSHTGAVVRRPPAGFNSPPDDDVPRVNFKPDEPWTDRHFDNAHPQLVSLEPDKMPGLDGGEMLGQWVVSAVLNDEA